MYNTCTNINTRICLRIYIHTCVASRSQRELWTLMYVCVQNCSHLSVYLQVFFSVYMYAASRSKGDICIFMYMRICVFMYVYTCLCLYICIYTHTHEHIYIHILAYTFTYIYIYIYMYVPMSSYECPRVYMCVHTPSTLSTRNISPLPSPLTHAQGPSNGVRDSSKMCGSLDGSLQGGGRGGVAVTGSSGFTMEVKNLRGVGRSLGEHHGALAVYVYLSNVSARVWCMCDMMRSCEWSYCLCVTWLIHMCDYTVYI